MQTTPNSTSNDFDDKWTARQVEAWLTSKYPAHATQFGGVNGQDIAKLSEEQLVAILGAVHGRILYNAIHPKAPPPGSLGSGAGSGAATPAERVIARLSELESRPAILDRRTAFNLNSLFKDVDFSEVPMRKLKQFIQTAHSHLTTSTRKSVANNQHYALDSYISSGVYYAFRDSTPYALKIPLVSSDVETEFTWSQQIDSPYIIKYAEVITLKPGLSALVMKAYTRSAEDMLNAWQTKGPAYTTSEEEDDDDTGDTTKITISHQAIANLFLTVIYAIRHLNTLQICHSDIKPANILIDSAGKMVLADLGAMVQYGRSLMEATEVFSMVNIENPIAEYGKRGCLQMDMVCLVSTLMAFVTHKRAARLVGLVSKVHVWKERGNFIASLADVCLQCNITSTCVDLDRMIAAGEALILENRLNLLV